MKFAPKPWFNPCKADKMYSLGISSNFLCTFEEQALVGGDTILARKSQQHVDGSI